MVLCAPLLQRTGLLGPTKVLTDPQIHRQWTWHGMTYWGQITYMALAPVWHVVWALPDLSNITTEAFELDHGSVWSPLISVNCFILGYTPICHSRACCVQAAIHALGATSTALWCSVLCHTCRQCCQISVAAQKALFGMTSLVGLQSGDASSGIVW